jgi:hypothetical protein
MNAWIALLSVTLCVATLCAAQNPPELAKRFDYDHAAPLSIERAGTQHRGDVTIEDITYTGADGGKVPAYLVVPAGKVHTQQRSGAIG